MTIRRVTTIQEAIESLDWFNYFHDGFIKRLTVLSRDEFVGRGEQRCSGELRLEITFAHYNYQRDERPHSQMIEASFEGVKDLSVSFSGNSHEWAINTLTIGETSRAREDGEEESCLKAVLAQSRLKDGREWVLHEDLSFTFRGCTFSEIETT
ncbi:MAG: hypothetical protein L0229_07015 [Blastocatellia bacterium]|nr:hypothetical protein [Blastocatellia bacterium]